MRDIKWRTQHGEDIALSDMTDTHVKNTFNMLLNQSHDIDFAIDTMPDGALPSTAYQEQRDLNRWVRRFENEIDKRKLS